MKQEAINTFSEGLITDLNTLVTPNNVLTNCLNGTFITYNGNELVLQTDLGNGRVESAFLPSGYVPVGIQEHGGIIYVASYNPMKNKGQIGSFPSPERNISSDELSDSQLFITENQFIKAPFQSIVRTQLINKSNTYIRPGDKFSLILTGIDKSIFHKLISHYNNTEVQDGNKQVKSFKNKLLNIDLGIIDNQGGIKIITNQLKRINPDTGEIIDFIDNTPESVKQNDGFWASNTKLEQDMNLEDYRKNKSVNTYNNKLVGDLYVISSINTIQSVDFFIYGERLDNKASLTLDITYKYNCPDGKYSDTNIQNKQILGYEEDNVYPNVIGNGKFKIGNSEYIDVPYIPSTLHTYSYSEQDNLYTAQFTYTINDIEINNLNDIREFEYIPTMQFGDNTILLEGLKTKGTINLSNLGTGIINLNSWRYFCTRDNITLTWGLEMYLKPKEEVENIVFKFHNLKNNKTIEYYPSKRYNYNGVFTDIINNTSGLQYGECYYVEIVVNTNKQKDLKFYRWLLFTTLYNNIYYSGLQDFGNDTEQMQNLRQVYLQSDIEYSINSSSSEQLDESGKANITTDDKDISGNIKKTQIVTYNIEEGYSFINSEAYPFECNDNYTTSISQKDSIIESSPIVQGTTFDSFGEISSKYDNGLLTVKYTTISPYTLKKSGPKTVTYKKVLTKYEERLKNNIKFDSKSSILTGIAILFFIREHKNSGIRYEDHHGYAFYYGNGQTIWSAQSFDDPAYTVQQERNGQVDFVLGSGGYEKMVSDINKSGNTPVFLQVCTDLEITPSQTGGTTRPESWALQKRRMLLWYDGNKYCFVNSPALSSPSETGVNLMSKVIDQFKDIYLLQNKEIIISDRYFPTIEGSSYVVGGNVKFETELTMTITPQSNALDDKFSLESIKQFLQTILTEDVETEANKMLFNINESTSKTSIIKELSIYDLTQYISNVTTTNTEVTEPTIYDGTTIYYVDGLNNTINPNFVYDKNMQPISELTLSLIEGEYHIVPKVKGAYGNYDNYGQWGSGDSYSTLTFQNIPVINYK